MVLGSFVAGVSAAGGGAVAYPALTLLLAAKAHNAKDFSLLIQSVGMTAASLLIIYRRIEVEWKVLRLVALPGVMGVLIGSRYLVPFMNCRSAKLAFGAIWFAFALALYLVLTTRDYHRRTKVELGNRGGLVLVLTGLCGGMLTACFGSGADLSMFSVVVLYFGLCEKVATPTSVVLMAFLSLVGAFNRLWGVPIEAITLSRWFACIPIVVCGAPLGAYVCSLLSRNKVALLLIFILCLQFAGVLFVLTPDSTEWSLILLLLTGSFVFFHWLSKQNQLDSIESGSSQTTVAAHQGPEERPKSAAQYQLETSE